jgi:transposase-like protein
MTRKRYTPTFKAQVVQELLKEDNTLAQLASEFSVHSNQLTKWRATALPGMPISLHTRKAQQGILSAQSGEEK